MVQFDTIKISRSLVRSVLVTSSVSEKTLAKSHDYSRLFSQEKRRLKMAQRLKARNGASQMLNNKYSAEEDTIEEV